jgi:aryl-alcohol dehydrogenase-like predicted oxidoreductase
MKTITLFENSQNPLKVSQLSLGCDYYGLERPESEAFRIMDTYYELGGRFFDTAHVYGQEKVGAVSHSEQTVGKWIAANGLEGKVVVSDKGAHPDRNNMLVSRISEKNIRDELFSSLEALKMNQVDIWFLHRDNPDMPVGEIVDMVSELVDQGYIKHLGVSNWKVERISKALAYAKEHNKHPFEISQVQWSLAISTAESWDDPTIVCMDEKEESWYKETQFPVMVYSPQARGLFSKVIEQGVDYISDKVGRRFLLDENLGRIERCKILCEDKNMNAAGVCLSYLTSAPFPVMPIIGCSNPQQVKDSIKFSDVILTDEERDFLVM